MDTLIYISLTNWSLENIWNIDQKLTDNSPTYIPYNLCLIQKSFPLVSKVEKSHAIKEIPQIQVQTEHSG